MKTYCNENDWIANNSSNYDYYYSNFPLAQNNLELPISFDFLKRYYINDMNSRSLEPQEAWLNCYEALFSYLLSRLTGTVTFQGRNWLELTWQNLPGAFGTTFKQITSPFGVPILIWLLSGVVIILALKK